METTLVRGRTFRQRKGSKMNASITVRGRVVEFTMDEATRRWSALHEQQEGDFPLIVVRNGKRYELYSDGTFAEVER